MNAQETYKKLFAKNLRYYMGVYGFNQIDLAKRVGTTAASVSNWMNEVKAPRMEKIDKLCEIFHCSRSDLITDRSDDNGVKVPVLGRVSAGLPLIADENIIDYEEITPKMARQGQFFGLKIRGDSMHPLLFNGDIVIVRQQPDADSGDYVIAMIDGEDAVCKKLEKFDNGTIVLMSLNPNYKPLIFGAKDNVKIIGKIVEMRRKL